MAFEYVLPVGLHLGAELPPAIEEGYEVHWRDDEDLPHYFFYVQVSTLRLERLVLDALRQLPAECQAVLEIRRSEEDMEADPEGPAQDRWVSGVVAREDVLEVFERYRFQILHDGTVGFGAYDPDSPLEVFVDDHKLVSLFAPGLEPFEDALAAHAVPFRERIETVLDVDHEHYSLVAVPDRFPSPRREWLRRRRYDVEWFTRAIRSRLRMRLQPHCEAAE